MHTQLEALKRVYNIHRHYDHHRKSFDNYTTVYIREELHIF